MFMSIITSVSTIRISAIISSCIIVVIIIIIIIIVIVTLGPQGLRGMSLYIHVIRNAIVMTSYYAVVCYDIVCYKYIRIVIIYISLSLSLYIYIGTYMC